MQVLTFVLNPKNVDAAAIFAPGLALQSLFSLPSAARELAPKLLQLLVIKATCCEMEELRGALLPVIARCASSRLKLTFCGQEKLDVFGARFPWCV